MYIAFQQFICQWTLGLVLPCINLPLKKDWVAETTNIFFFLQFWILKVKVLEELVSPEAFLLGWQRATFSCGLSLCVNPWCLFHSLLIIIPIILTQDHSLRLHFTIKISKYSYAELQHIHLGKTQFISQNTSCLL